MKRKKVLFVFGTRPEAIKMAPIVKACQDETDRLETRVCITGQHREMLQQVMDFFELKADYDLDLMQPNQTLFDITALALTRLKPVLDDFAPDLLLVQGDTTTAMAAALAAYYQKIPVGHVEAGLRSGDIFSPFPEEANRKIIGTISTYHFAPTELARKNLQQEQQIKHVFVTGNSVIDALLWGVRKVKESGTLSAAFPFLKEGRRLVLVTAHRRESFGAPFESICRALFRIAQQNPETDLVYPVHLNPQVREVVYRTLQGQANIHLLPPASYPELLWLLDRSYLVITDSGGIQEEAPALGKPVLVMREVTERQEGIDAGTARLVGTDEETIVSAAQTLLDDTEAYEAMAKAVNPYGDGHTAAHIVSILLNH